MHYTHVGYMQCMLHVLYSKPQNVNVNCERAGAGRPRDTARSQFDVRG